VKEAGKMGAPPPIVTFTGWRGLVGEVPTIITSLSWQWPKDCDWLPTNAPEVGKQGNAPKIPFPSIMTINISLTESFSAAQFNNFNLTEFKSGNMLKAYIPYTLKQDTKTGEAEGGKLTNRGLGIGAVPGTGGLTGVINQARSSAEAVTNEAKSAVQSAKNTASTAVQAAKANASDTIKAAVPGTQNVVDSETGTVTTEVVDAPRDPVTGRLLSELNTPPAPRTLTPEQQTSVQTAQQTIADANIAINAIKVKANEYKAELKALEASGASAEAVDALVTELTAKVSVDIAARNEQEKLISRAQGIINNP
jgi:hypothetical protein